VNLSILIHLLHSLLSFSITKSSSLWSNTPSPSAPTRVRHAALLGGRGLVANVGSLLLAQARARRGGRRGERARRRHCRLFAKSSSRPSAKPSTTASATASRCRPTAWRATSCSTCDAQVARRRGAPFAPASSLAAFTRTTPRSRQLEIDAFALFYDSNALYPTIFPSLRKMEVEVVNMTLALLHGRIGDACGT
jgi:hypothetical protein